MKHISSSNVSAFAIHPIYSILEKVQPDLEILDTSVYTESEEETQEKTAVPRGQLHFSIDYDFDKTEVGAC